MTFLHHCTQSRVEQRTKNLLTDLCAGNSEEHLSDCAPDMLGDISWVESVILTSFPPEVCSVTSPDSRRAGTCPAPTFVWPSLAQLMPSLPSGLTRNVWRASLPSKATKTSLSAGDWSHRSLSICNIVIWVLSVRDTDLVPSSPTLSGNSLISAISSFTGL